MDGDGGGMDGGAMSGVDGGVLGGTDGGGGAGTESADGDHPDSGVAALQSMGYVDSGTGMDKVDGDSSGSGISVLKSVVITAVVLFFGFSLVYFLITGILAMLGVQL